ncbi:MAG: T9SS type A sorting domain-containing protein [candidate division KSB1 bacterium]|nr:T9SS type A sorting domain-containing protein [candidate division KSB1 bacterium]
MNRRYLTIFLTAAGFSFTLSAQTPVEIYYGTLATGPNSIAFIDDMKFVKLDVMTEISTIISASEFGGSGAIGYLTGSEWLIGKTSDAKSNPGSIFVLNDRTGAISPPKGNFNDVRDLAVIDKGNRLDAIVIDRAKDKVHLVTDVMGTAVSSEITPASIAGKVGIQGLAVLSDSLYFLYDEAPGGGFGNDQLIIVEGSTPAAKTTTLSWNDIGSAGAGLQPDELSVDFHNGLAVRQPDPSTVKLYLSNFGSFSDAQIIEVTWVNSGNGFDFSAPISSVLFYENDLFAAIVDNNPAALVPEGKANSRGVAVLPGETQMDDQLLIWVDDSVNDNTYMLMYKFSDGSFSLFGGDALERALKTSRVTAGVPDSRLLLNNYPNPFNPSTEIVYSLPRNAFVELNILDARGRFVTRLAEGFQPAGEYTQTWNGKNNEGQEMPSGVYLCQLKTENQIRIHKMLLMR